MDALEALEDIGAMFFIAAAFAVYGVWRYGPRHLAGIHLCSGCIALIIGGKEYTLHSHAYVLLLGCAAVWLALVLNYSRLVKRHPGT